METTNPCGEIAAGPYRNENPYTSIGRMELYCESIGSPMNPAQRKKTLDILQREYEDNEKRYQDWLDSQ